MPKMNPNRTPDTAGALLVQLQGRSQVVQVVPKMYEGEQTKTADGLPKWAVKILHIPADGSDAVMVDATLASKSEPSSLVGAETEKPIMLGAYLWRREGFEKWTYNLNSGLIRQFQR